MMVAIVPKRRPDYPGFPSMLSSFGNLVMVHSCVEQEGDMHLLQRFLQDESGATAIEYGLIAACIALAIIASVKGVSNNLKSTFNNVSANLR